MVSYYLQCEQLASPSEWEAGNKHQASGFAGNILFCHYQEVTK